MESSQNPSRNGGSMDAPSTATPASDGAAAATLVNEADESKQNLTLITNSIRKTLGLLHQLHLNVSSFNAASQLPLLERLNGLVGELDTMQKLAENCDYQIPMEVISLIDEGKNPDEFTKDVFNSCITKNQITKGKTDSFKAMLRKHLLEDLDQVFPEEIESYREIRASAAAETRRLAQAQSGSLPNGDVKVKTEQQ